MAKSGVDSLLDALRASGADVDGKFGNTQKKDSESSGSSEKSSDSNKTSSSSKKPQTTIPEAFMDLKFVEKLKNLTKKGRVIAIIVALVILGILYWWFHPPLNLQSETTWGIIIVLLVIPMFAIFLSKAAKYGVKGKFTGRFFDDTAKKSAKKVMNEENKKKGKKFLKLCWIPGAICIVGLLGMLLGATFFPGNAQRYASILPSEELDFKTDIPQVDYNQIPIIDRETAKVLGTKEMGTISDYVSQFEISNLYSQISFQNKPVRVSPLNYADLFKWLTNREAGIPAYCRIDMATQDAKIIRLTDVDGEGAPGVKYSESEPLARNIHRYIQLKYPTYMFDELSFEVDDNGHPQWICPVQGRTIGLFGGKTIKRVVICDAVSGECEDMAIEDVPQWVDRAYPSELLIEQYNWSGKYKNGWINSWLGQNGVVKTTPGTSSSSSSSNGTTVPSTLGYNYIAKDDDVWVYTGVTSATSDTSVVGFILVNQRTAESHFYSVSGATEVSAMESAQGQVQNLRYTASFPILINIGNQPTYFMPLKDSAGLVKKYAMIDIQRYQNVAIGDTVADCQKSYQSLLAREGVDMSSQNFQIGTVATGVISNMATAVVDGNSHFYVTLQGDSNIYDFVLPGMLPIVKYRIGDTISFTYTKGQPASTVSAIN